MVYKQLSLMSPWVQHIYSLFHFTSFLLISTLFIVSWTNPWKEVASELFADVIHKDCENVFKINILKPKSSWSIFDRNHVHQFCHLSVTDWSWEFQHMRLAITSKPKHIPRAFLCSCTIWHIKTIICSQDCRQIHSDKMFTYLDWFFRGSNILLCSEYVSTDTCYGLSDCVLCQVHNSNCDAVWGWAFGR